MYIKIVRLNSILAITLTTVLVSAQKPVPFKIDLLNSNSLRVMYIGEGHPDPAPKLLLKENFSTLKDMGFTHLGLESLNRSSQSLLDAYSKGQISKQKLWERFEIEWGWNDSIKYYIEMVDAAIKAGIKLVALDGRDVVDFDKYGTDNNHDVRDYFMAESIYLALKNNPNSKIIVLIGADHIKQNRTFGLYQPKLLFENYQLSSLEIVISEACTQVKSYSNVDGIRKQFEIDYYKNTSEERLNLKDNGYSLQNLAVIVEPNKRINLYLDRLGGFLCNASL